MNISLTPELIGIFLTLVTSLLTLGYVFGGLKKSITNLEKDVDNVRKDVDNVRKNMDSKFERFEREVNYKIDKLNDKLDSFIIKTEHRLSLLEGQFAIAGNSPKRQTSGGKKIFNDLDGKSFIDQNFAHLNSLITAEAEYDIQEQSIVAIEQTVTPEYRSKLASYAYREGWKLDQIYEAYGLYLRDLLFKDKGIPVP